MADTIHDEMASFLDDLATDLTNLHVKAAAYQNAPVDQDAVDDLAAIPGALIERAQYLKTRLDADAEVDSDPDAKPKAKAKSAASKR